MALHQFEPVLPFYSAPEWCRNANIYEVNLRQFSPEGTFEAFRRHLPRLKYLGVDILWFMPLHPIGQENRKGRLGSYYAVKDYLAVNAEFGTLEEFRSLVKEAHETGMHVLIDWVANHTAWDNPLARAHPEWFVRDETGRFLPPFADWPDVIGLDYRHAGLRRYMRDAMLFWLKETDIDGFRCDVAEWVPYDFWTEARQALDRVKPVFMLAEGASPNSHRFGFDMTYSWNEYHLMNRVANRRNGHARDFWPLLEKERRDYPEGAIRMRFVTNHDKNSWNGSAVERLKSATPVLTALSLLMEGMPLVYSGQEAGLDKRLDFFEKDPIAWRPHGLADMIRTLLHLKKRHPALWNGAWGAPMMPVSSSQETDVLSFLREKEDRRVLAVLNLSPDEQTVTLTGQSHIGTYENVFRREPRRFSGGDAVTLPAWGYEVWESQLKSDE